MWKWRLTAAGINLLLGIPAVVPLFLIWYYLANGPLADAGLTSREPTENDGMTLWLVIVVPVVAVFGIIWWLANDWVRPRASLAPGAYWTAGAVLTLWPVWAAVVTSVA
ncbi:hypothetical protein [Streptomyces nitrosporeus]|uniref:hypothetical protein n=1 Tax=Streptomyces nitrosporeus TaxID=28894 RepID=UPI0039A10E0F